MPGISLIPGTWLSTLVWSLGDMFVGQDLGTDLSIDWSQPSRVWCSLRRTQRLRKARSEPGGLGAPECTRGAPLEAEQPAGPGFGGGGLRGGTEGEEGCT